VQWQGLLVRPAVAHSLMSGGPPTCLGICFMLPVVTPLSEYGGVILLFSEMGLRLSRNLLSHDPHKQHLKLNWHSKQKHLDHLKEPNSQQPRTPIIS